MWLEQMVHRIALFLVRKDILDKEVVTWVDMMLNSQRVKVKQARCQLHLDANFSHVNLRVL